MTLTGDILRSWRAPRAVLRRRLAMADGERSAIFYLLLACVLIFVAQWPRLAMQAATDDTIPFQGLMAGALFGWLFVAPLLFYAIGAIIGLVVRLIQPGTPWLAVRLALFWALLAISPLVLLQGALAPMAGAQSVVALVSGLAVLAGFLVLLGAGLRVALEAAQAAA